MEDSDLPIAKVPITNLPVGVTNLMNISKIPIDWEHPEVMDDMFVREKDNKYGLDGWFEYGDVFDVGMAKFSRMKNQYDLLRYSVLEEPERLYFCKRLPPVVGTPSGDFEVLIYNVSRTSDTQPNYPLWVLLMVGRSDGDVGCSVIIAGTDCKENDVITRFLCEIDSDYVLTIKIFGTPNEATIADMGDSYDPNYLYEFQADQYQISEGIRDK